MRSKSGWEMLKGKRVAGHKEQGTERCNWKQGFPILIPSLPQLYSQQLQCSLELG